METVNLESVIQQTITRFKHNRSGDKPLVFVSVSPSIGQIRWGRRQFERVCPFVCL
jgi:hypothetical protein